MLHLLFPTPEKAFMELNRILLFDTNSYVSNFGTVYAQQMSLYDVLVTINKSDIDEEFDFTRLVNYRPAKWTSLVNNYVNRVHLQQILASVNYKEQQKDKNYNVSFHFTNEHSGGKGCLLTATFSRRLNQEQPMIIATVRASETVKRLMMDFLLLRRIGQEAWGEEADFSLQVYFPYMWLASDWAALYIHWDVKARKMVQTGPGSRFLAKVLERYNQMENLEDIDGLNYHALKRVAKVIQGKGAEKPLLAKDCRFNF